jgi:hypothetical protein
MSFQPACFLVLLAERVGFEPTVTCATPDFESGTFGHSATSPLGALILSADLGNQFSQPAHVGLQHRWNINTTVFALIVLQDSHEGAPDRQA